MTRHACNADLGHPCDANDGEPCDACAATLAAERAYYGAQWAVASPVERDPERYAREMRDAGRGAPARRPPISAPSRFAIRAALLALAGASEQMTRCLHLDCDDETMNRAAVALDRASAAVDAIARSLLSEKRAQERALGLAVLVDSGELRNLLTEGEANR